MATERVLTRKLGSERLQQLLGQIETMEAEAGTGKGAPSSDVWFDGARLRTGNDDGLRPSGTQFFQTDGSASQSSEPAPTTAGSYKRATAQDADQTIKHFGSVPGGVVLEGVATGLGEIMDVSYDTRFNAFILNDRAAYFLKIPPKTLALLCRAISEDDKERVGVSLSRKPVIYGRHFQSGMDVDSDLVWDLKLADNFLADMVFVYKGRSHWTAGYKFVKDFSPEQHNGNISFDIAVFFKFNGFQFRIEQEEVQINQSKFDVQLFPLSGSKAADGGFLPDETLISRGEMPEELERNATHLAENISYYRREKIVDRIFVYGEVAAFIRALKEAGFDLEALADSIPSGR